jgi:phosphoinositide-3-kinase, regulatory subunit 4
MSQPGHLGPITCMCLDRTRSWLVSGTLNGVLSLWDIRFGILIRSWKVSLPGGKVTQCAVDPMRGEGSWVMVAVNGESAETPFARNFVIEVWDVERMKLVEIFTSRPGADASPNSKSSLPEEHVDQLDSRGGAAEAIALLLQRQKREKTSAEERSMILESPFLHPENDSPIFTHTISCFLVGINFYGPGYIAGTEGLEIYIGADDFAMPSVTQDIGFLLSGSRDCRLRFWDLNQIEKSRIICGADIEDEKPSFWFVLLFILEIHFLIKYIEGVRPV